MKRHSLTCWAAQFLMGVGDPCRIPPWGALGRGAGNQELCDDSVCLWVFWDRGALGSQVHGCGGAGPRGLREVTPDAAPGTQLGKGGPHRWLARCHSFCHDRMDTSYEVIYGLLGKRPQDQIKLIFA